MKNDNDYQLLQQLKLGREVAFRAIFDKYWWGIFTAANELLKSDDLAKEVVDNLFGALWTERLSITDLRQFIFHKSNELIIAALHRIARERKGKGGKPSG